MRRTLQDAFKHVNDSVQTVRLDGRLRHVIGAVRDLPHLVVSVLVVVHSRVR